MRLDEIDKNFKVETKLDLPDVKFHDPRREPFKIYGVFFEGGLYRRIPEGIAKTVSDGVATNGRYSTGGRIKFKTTSKYIAISVKCQRHLMPHCALSGSSGFDIYAGKNYIGTFIPPFGEFTEYEAKYTFPDRRMREITINMPLFTTVSEIYVGLEERARVEKTRGYKYEKPIVFYGSSITHGGCASRPGTCYEGFISRRLDTDYINLGFSGCAKGEDSIAEYISGLDTSVFVYDYDHNAPTAEHLEKTHERMFLKVRAANPDLPILMLSRPKYYLTEAEKKRLEIVKKTYENALARGDKNVYFIPGPSLMKYAKDEGTVDGCHPTDLGFYSMAKVIIPTIKKILEGR